MRRVLTIILTTILTMSVFTVPAMAENPEDMYNRISHYVSYPNKEDSESLEIDFYRSDMPPIPLYRAYFEDYDAMKLGVKEDFYSEFSEITEYNLCKSEATLAIKNVTKDKEIDIEIFLRAYAYRDGKYVADLLSMIESTQEYYIVPTFGYYGGGKFLPTNYGSTLVRLNPGEEVKFDLNNLYSNPDTPIIMPEKSIYLATVYVSDMTGVGPNEEYDYIWEYFSFKVDPEEYNEYFSVQNSLKSPETIHGIPSSWAIPTVKSAIEAGIVPKLSDGPKYTSTITREQFAELIVSMVETVCGEEPLLGTTSFLDTKNEKVLLAAQMGIVSGMGDGTFAPKKETNREQIAAMIDRAIIYINWKKGLNLAPNPANIEQFVDKYEVSSWATQSVGRLAANGIMMGTAADMLSPKNKCTVEQSIALSYRVFSLIK